MKTKGSLKPLGSICLVLLLAVVLLAACAQPTPAPEPITLKGVTFLVKGNILHDNFYAPFQDKVNEQAKGKLVLEWVGSVEAIPIQEQVAATQKGVTDFTWTATSFTQAIVPASAVLGLSELTAQEERETGVYDYLVEQFEKAGLFYLGRGIVSEPTFYLFTDKKIERLQDFSGLKIATTPKALGFIETLGAVGVQMSFRDFYTAMDQGVIDGFGNVLVGATGYGWQEVTNYVVDCPIGFNTIMVLINLDEWNKIPKDLQDVLIEAMKEVEQESPPIYEELRAQERAAMEEAGVQFIKLSPDETKLYSDIYYKGLWEAAVELDPEVIGQLKKMMVK